MQYQRNITKYLVLFGPALLFVYVFTQYYRKNVVLGNGKEDRRNPSLKDVVQGHLTNQQRKTYLHENWFLEPSMLAYNLSKKFQSKKYFSQYKQDKLVDEYFKSMRNGIFLEVGAADGVTISNTLFFERKRNWTGVLIEPNRDLYNSLVTVKRKSYSINACLSLNEKIDVVSFLPAEFLGGLEKSLAEEKMMGRIKHEYPLIKRDEVLCIPLYTILKAIDMTHIHFFSLDVEGAEMDILRTIPFDLVTIELFLIEYYVPYGATETQKRLKEFRDFFNNLGTYKEIHLGSVDVTFARK